MGDEGDIVQEKKSLMSLDSKLAKYASLMAEVLKSPSPEPGPSSLPDPSSPQPGPSRALPDINLKRKSRDQSSEPEEPSKKKRKELLGWWLTSLIPMRMRHPAKEKPRRRREER